jgi:hypothetical protein
MGEKRGNCSCFDIDQEMDAILLVIGIALLFPCKQIIWPRFLRMQLTLLVTGKNE